ncbi:MAG: dodecin family protein [Methanotrichaceae archaeon]
MAGSVYNIVELVGSSQNSWEEAAQNAIATASKKLTNIRIAEIVELDATIEGKRIVEYRAKIRLSFKVEIEPETL